MYLGPQLLPGIHWKEWDEFLVNNWKALTGEEHGSLRRYLEGMIEERQKQLKDRREDASSSEDVSELKHRLATYRRDMDAFRG